MEQLRSLWSRMGRDRIFWSVIAAVVALYFVFALPNALSITLTVLALMVAITVHECGHAWAADQLGDPTARLMGRVTLNPLKHLDPIGSLMIVITSMTGVGIGWGKPTPVVPYRLKYGTRKGSALVSLAGPLANLLTATLAAILLRGLLAFVPGFRDLLNGSVMVYFYTFLRALVGANTVIAFFNLLPIPPLDGHSVLIGLVSLSQSDWALRAVQWLEGLRRYGSVLLFGLIIISAVLPINLIGILIGPPAGFFYGLLMGTAG